MSIGSSRGGTLATHNLQVIEARQPMIMDLRRITLDDGTQITATGSHPFWDPNSFQWQPLEDFGIGDPLASRQGLREITHIELLPEGATVYNIEVAG